MRWKPETAPVDSDEVHEPDTGLRDRIRSGLEARGVESGTADALAEHLEKEIGAGAAGQAAVLDGVALGLRAQSAISQDLHQDLARSTSELQELERLMGSFASELSKLDEVLEVLAAYLRRMRATAPASGSRILH